jgi:HipA-like C-terminal domain
MQSSAELVDVATWSLDEDFAIFPVGSKPKRALLCPSPSPYPFLIEGHRYLFKVSTGWRIYQHWSEVVAYELARTMGAPRCAPCFVAWDSSTGEVGVVVEFFYGHPQAGVPARFLAGADLMRRAFEDFDSDTDGTHTWNNVQLICRAFVVPDRLTFWAQLLAFDALIGNTDRHSENWGLLAKQSSSGPDWHFTMAPAFDHGTSLAYQVRDEDLARESSDAAILKHLSRGTHHLRLSAERAVRGHFDLCQIIIQANATVRAAVEQMLVPSVNIDEILSSCCAFELPQGRCSNERADYLVKLVKARRDALAAILKA